MKINEMPTESQVKVIARINAGLKVKQRHAVELQELQTEVITLMNDPNFPIKRIIEIFPPLHGIDEKIKTEIHDNFNTRKNIKMRLSLKQFADKYNMTVKEIKQVLYNK